MDTLEVQPPIHIDYYQASKSDSALHDPDQIKSPHNLQQCFFQLPFRINKVLSALFILNGFTAAYSSESTNAKGHHQKCSKSSASRYMIIYPKLLTAQLSGGSQSVMNNITCKNCLHSFDEQQGYCPVCRTPTASQQQLSTNQAQRKFIYFFIGIVIFCIVMIAWLPRVINL